MGSQKILYTTITATSAQIDISQLPAGIYLVKVIGERIMQVEKIIKQ